LIQPAHPVGRVDRKRDTNMSQPHDHQNETCRNVPLSTAEQLQKRPFDGPLN
jgi:hypothetical protein